MDSQLQVIPTAPRGTRFFFVLELPSCTGPAAPDESVEPEADRATEEGAPIYAAAG